MKNFLKNFFLVGVVVALAFVFRVELQVAKDQILVRYFPCKQPIDYSIGEFSTKFGISREDFLLALKDAEEIWESPIDKNLFQYNETGSLQINLIYDERQETTDELNDLGEVIDSDRVRYNTLRSQYTTLKSQYLEAERTFDAKVAAFETRKAAYEAEVKSVNRGGKATKATYDRLEAERVALNALGAEINKMQDDLNAQVVTLNQMVNNLNSVARSLNLKVDVLNKIGEEVLGEFEEGTYETGPDGQEINIYQFENRTKLVRVLAHEFGHALTLDHINDPKAIMYRLNNGINEKLTEADIAELKKLCKIK